MNRPLAISLLFASAGALLTRPAVAQPALLWIKQFGSTRDDWTGAAASDGVGGVFAGGTTLGDVGGGGNAGSFDAFLTRYGSEGQRYWVLQFGTKEMDELWALAQDAEGGAYAAGFTLGSLGGKNEGGTDAWLARYSAVGARDWIKQFGTTQYDYVNALAPDDGGGVYAAGQTNGSLGGQNLGQNDAWLARYDAGGQRTWITQFGTPDHDEATALAPDGGGGVLLGGDSNMWRTPFDVDKDGFIASYDGSGAQRWFRWFGTLGDEVVGAMAPDGGGGAYIAGYTTGDLGAPNAGEYDGVISRYDSTGEQLWVAQFGTAARDAVTSLAPDGEGGAFFGGYTYDSLAAPNAGGHDAFVGWIDESGNMTWITQFGTTSEDYLGALASDGAGGVFGAGTTYGWLGDQHIGLEDAFIVRYATPCYPDFTGDGALDLFDFLAYVNAFNAGDPAADCVPDGFLDLFDFLCFVNAYKAGC